MILLNQHLYFLIFHNKYFVNPFTFPSISFQQIHTLFTICFHQIRINQMEYQNPLKKPRVKASISGQPKYNLQQIVEQLKIKGNLPIQTMRSIIRQASHLLQRQSNLLKLNSPLNIVGDIHGQFFDLINIFQLFGNLPQNNYLFLGDYVDRGKFCIEVMTLLLVLKISFPQKIYLLRGNHQGKTMTSHFNFKLQCDKKYNSQIYQYFIDLFTKLPLCALIDNKYFAVHGGISPNIKSTSDIEKLNRFCQIVEKGTLCDLLWSDPIDTHNEQWQQNTMRCCSFYYSRKQATQFLSNNNLKIIIRAHQVQMKGFKYQHNEKNQPLTLTIFSAPNYCDTYNNKGAIAVLNGRNIQVRTFKDVEHPFVSNNYLNAIDLSCPMIAIGVSKIFNYFLKTKVKGKITHDKNFTQILKKMENSEKMMNNLSISINQIHQMLLPSKQDGKAGLSKEDQSYFYQANERLPIFGPKQLQFIKIQVNRGEEDYPLLDELC